MLHERLTVVIEDDGPAVTIDLQTSNIRLVIAALLGVLVVIHHCVLVTCEELLFESCRIDQRWTKVQVLGIKPLRMLGIGMPRANLVVDSFKHALSFSILSVIANFSLL